MLRRVQTAGANRAQSVSTAVPARTLGPEVSSGPTG